MPTDREEEVPEDRKLGEQGNTDAKLFVPDDSAEEADEGSEGDAEGSEGSEGSEGEDEG